MLCAMPFVALCSNETEAVNKKIEDANTQILSNHANSYSFSDIPAVNGTVWALLVALFVSLLVAIYFSYLGVIKPELAIKQTDWIMSFFPKWMIPTTIRKSRINAYRKKKNMTPIQNWT